MNIQELSKQAIERINNMSLEELKNKFIEHCILKKKKI